MISVEFLVLSVQCLVFGNYFFVFSLQSLSISVECFGFRCKRLGSKVQVQIVWLTFALRSELVWIRSIGFQDLNSLPLTPETKTVNISIKTDH